MKYRVQYGKYDNQLATGYIIYMMAGSMFHKCVCRSKMAERSNYLHYVEMPRNREEELEDRVLRVLDNLDEEFCEALAGLNCEVSFQAEGDDYRIMFRTGGFEELEASVSPDGRFEITPVAACPVPLAA